MSFCLSFQSFHILRSLGNDPRIGLACLQLDTDEFASLRVYRDDIGPASRRQRFLTVYESQVFNCLSEELLVFPEEPLKFGFFIEENARRLQLFDVSLRVEEPDLRLWSVVTV